VNRKQQRTAGHSGAATASGSAVSGAPGALADLFSAAVAQHQAGALAEAERQYRHYLSFAPAHAEAQSRMGAVLMGQGKIAEAVAHLERAVALGPDLFEAFGNLAQAYLAAGRAVQAVEAAERALELRETAPGKALFAHCARYARFTADNGGRYRKLMLRALSEGWARPRDLTAACISLIKRNLVVIDCIARANAAWPARLPLKELGGPSGTAALANDQLLHCLLASDPVTDIGLERVLTNVRHAMLTADTTDGAYDEDVFDFYCALARQCFINEYVFSMTDAEAKQAQGLRASLEQSLTAGEPCPALWPVIVGAYFPLHSLAKSEALFERSWPKSVTALIVAQVKEPLEERRIAATIRVLTEIDGEVSRAVRRHYEENPYPRWVVAGPPQQAAVRNDRQPEQAFDVLIAGCGTGLSAIEFARKTRQARVLAIDLSLASLSYAERMARTSGIANIEFAQADIMRLGSIELQFDFIDASGVLHHLADPWEGWRALLARLRPGGMMQVGLYSELARQHVVAARALIAERGYRPIPEDIRRCREEIMAADDGSLLKSLTQADDFFTTSECRDLLFHVQEHRITLPEIKSFLTANKLNFAGFILMPATMQKFAARFPARAALTDLDCWHTFETEAPDTFAEMYQFQVQKPARSQGTQPL
jgi:2-polyprenyl-3-methyl-5-hydroxy-6-metoxy-1,4-benzoquinol methylase